MNSSTEAAALLGVFEKQLRLFRELSADLVACRTAYVGMDLDAIYRHITTQTAICEQLRQIAEERRNAWRAVCLASGVDPEKTDLGELMKGLNAQSAEPVRDVVMRLAIAEGELRNLNRAHSVFIDGSRRTLAILGNVLGSFSPTYARPSIYSESVAGAITGSAQ